MGRKFHDWTIGNQREFEKFLCKESNDREHKYFTLEIIISKDSSK
jgi:hypothetical protein